MDLNEAKQFLESVGYELINEEYMEREDYAEKFEPIAEKPFNQICSRIINALSSENGEVKIKNSEVEYDQLTTIGKSPVVNCSATFVFSESFSDKMYDLSEKSYEDYEKETNKLINETREAIGDNSDAWNIECDWSANRLVIMISSSCVIKEDGSQIEWMDI